jgi:hypothetical protein
MTYQQIIKKVPCPTCGAERGKACGTGAGRTRMTAHDERTAKARGSMRQTMHSSGDVLSAIMAKLGFRKK